MELLAPAKVNLYLEVLDRRPDGYHTLESVMQTVSLYDRIVLEKRQRGLSLECSRPDLPTDERNLALKAAVALQKALGIEDGAHIILEKNIPLGAGLGGGSSDAAAVLKGLLKLWGKGMDPLQLNALAARLGADVPFFLEGGTAVAGGIGEKLERIRLVENASFILVYPGFPVATAGVYKSLVFPLTNKQKIDRMRRLLEAGSPADTWGTLLFNRLEEVVLPRYPELRQIKEALKGFGCRSLMSGSGSTVFGILPPLSEGEKIRAALKQLQGQAWLVHAVAC